MKHKLLLKAKLLLLLLLASAPLLKADNITDFKMTTTSQLIGAEATYTFTYTLLNDRPERLLQVSFNGIHGVNFHDLSTVIVKINGSVLSINRTRSWCYGVGGFSIVLDNDSQKYAVKDAKVEVSIKGTNYNRAGSASWSRIGTAYSGGGPIDIVENPPAVVFKNPAPPTPAVEPAKYINDTRFSLYWKYAQYGKKMRIEVAENKTFTSITYSTEVSIGDYHHTIRNLKPATTYYYRVRASNTTGNSDYTAVQSVTTEKTKPIITRWPKCQSITYGQPLSASHLINGIADVKGAFSFHDATHIPQKTGWNSVEVVFTPENTTTHEVVSKQINVRVDRKKLTIVNASAQNKIFDGTWSAVVSGATLSGVADADDVSLNLGSAQFSSRNVGEDITVTIHGSTIEGTDAGNYFLTEVSGLTANITPKDVTIINYEIKDKVYDGTTQATVVGGELSGIIPGTDADIRIISPPVFTQSAVGNNISITGDAVLVGADKDNYNLIIPAATANITPKDVTFINYEIKDKVYDGSTQATVVGGELSGIIPGTDTDIRIISPPVFTQSAVGNNIPITGDAVLEGADKDNYNLIIPAATANITPKDVTIINYEIKDKVYDGSTQATVVGGELSGIIPGTDADIRIISPPVFSRSSVGNNIPITGDAVLEGADKDNYNLIIPAATANITPKELTITNAVAQNKVYDGTTTATVNKAILNGLISGDNVALKLGSASFADKNAGADKAVKVTGSTISGTDAGNYSLTEVSGLSAAITPKKLVIASPDVTTSKIYDGSATALVKAGDLTNIESGDEVAVKATAVYENANAGLNKTIEVSYEIEGDAALNYLAPDKSSVTTAEIQPKQLSIDNTRVTSVKMQDGSTEAAVETIGTLSGVLEADKEYLSVEAKANYDDALAGYNKTISVEYALGGEQSSNYIAPAVKTISGAKVLEAIKFAETNGIVSPSVGGCENGTITVEYNIVSGDPLDYKLEFSALALSAGFENTDFMPLVSSALNGEIAIPVPSKMKEGVYEAKLTFANEIGHESQATTFAFKINLSSDFIVTKFDDVVLCDNSSNRFMSYQWYKNDDVINGATGQFYNDPAGLSGSYHLQVTTKDGEQLTTCPKMISQSLKGASLKVYPNPAVSGQDFTVEINHLSETELQDAVMSIYTINGLLAHSRSTVSRINKVQLPVGLYLGTVTTANGQQLTFKVQITN